MTFIYLKSVCSGIIGVIMPSSTSIVTTLALLAAPTLARVDYSGYQVLRITPQTSDDVAFLRDLAKDEEYDVWRDPRLAGVPAVKGDPTV